MGDLVRRWDELVLVGSIDSEFAPYAHRLIKQNQSVLLPGATDDELAEWQATHGLELPPSYLAFLRRSNGALADASSPISGDWMPADWYFPGFLPVSHLRPCSSAPSDPSRVLDTASDPIAAAYGPPAIHGNQSMPEWTYLAARDGSNSDSIRVKRGHYRHTMVVAVGEEEGCVMLNPLVREPNGEWEAWDYSYKHPGSYRYHSFRYLMEAVCYSLERGWGDEIDDRRSETKNALAAAAGQPRPKLPRIDIKQALTNFRNDGDYFWATQICSWSRESGEDAVEILGGLVASDPAPSSSSRLFVETLSYLGARQASTAAREVLRRQFRQRPETDLHSTIGEALALFGDRDDLEPISELCQEVDELPVWLVKLLGRVRSDESAAVLSGVAEQSEPNARGYRREYAVLALQDLASEPARIELADLNELQAWRCLARLGDERALDSLISIAERGSAVDRLSAIDGLRDLNHPESADFMRSVLDGAEPDSDEAAFAAHTLAVLRTDDAESLLSRIAVQARRKDPKTVCLEWIDQLLS